MFESPSATPSMNPREAAPDFNTELKKAGKTEIIISLEKSLKKETSPMKKTFFSTPKIRFILIILACTLSSDILAR